MAHISFKGRGIRTRKPKIRFRVQGSDLREVCARGSTETNPKGPRTQTIGLGPEYYTMHGTWALKPFYLGL